MFAYIQKLVEEDLFDVVEVFFLIVGHTHASIDQYFSVLAKRIKDRSFIGSPLALQALLARTEEDQNLSGLPSNRKRKMTERPRPLCVTKMVALFDLKKTLGSMIN